MATFRVVHGLDWVVLRPDYEKVNGWVGFRESIHVNCVKCRFSVYYFGNRHRLLIMSYCLHAPNGAMYASPDSIVGNAFNSLYVADNFNSD